MKIISLDSENTKIQTILKVDTSKFYPVNSKDKLQPIYDSAASFMWYTYVPKVGQAKTIQGELIRSLERLDNEIRGNAKFNWSKQYVILGNELKEYLISSKTFPREIEQEISNDVNLLIRKPMEVYTNDDVYDRLKRRIVEWYWRHSEPIIHTQNLKLKI